MEKKTVHIVVEDGFVVDAYADFDVEVEVLDLDSSIPEERAYAEEEIERLKKSHNVVNVY